MRLSLVRLKPYLPGGYGRRIAKLIRLMNLKPITDLHFQFDPFTRNTDSAREALFHLSAEKVQLSNPLIQIKTTVVDDRSPPLLRANFADGGIYLIKTGNMSGVEVLEQVDRLVQLREKRTFAQSRLPRQRGKWGRVYGAGRPPFLGCICLVPSFIYKSAKTS